MAKLGTYCQHCCFYDSKNKTCHHGLIDVFKQRGASITEDDDSHIIIDRVCRYRRDKEWNKDLSLEEKANICCDEIFLSGSVILLVNDTSNLKETLTKLKDVTNNKFNFLISHSTKLSSVLSIAKDVDICASFVKSVGDDISDEKRVFDTFKYLKNGYVFTLDTSQTIDYSIFKKIHYFTNKMMFRILHVKGNNDTIHESVSMTHLYKWLNGDLMEPFAKKLVTIAAAESSDAQIWDWKTLNELYGRPCQ